MAKHITDAWNSDPQAIEDSSGPVARALVAALDKAVAMQTSTITAYVSYLHSRKNVNTPQKLQQAIDKHFRRIASGSGATVGATAAVPGIGFVTGSAAVAGESLVFLDAAAFYTIASAYVRGMDISDPQVRRALILIILTGTKGTALVDIAMDTDSLTNPAALVSRTSGPKLSGLNKQLMDMAVKKMSKKLLRGWVGKILPLGIGAVAGTVVNRRLAKAVISNARVSLGPLPEEFTPSVSPKEKTKQRNLFSKIISRVQKRRKKSEPAEEEILDEFVLTAAGK